MCKQSSDHSKSERGVTMSEILISIVLFALIFLPFWQMFDQVRDPYDFSATVLQGTYEAQRQIEYVYAISQDYSLQEGRMKFQQDGFFEMELTASQDFKYEKTEESYHVVIELRTAGYSDNLVNVVVKIYEDETLEQLYTQTEMTLAWER